MKKLWMIAILGVFGFAMISCTGCTKVPAGNVGVKVYLLGKTKGVDTEVLSVGRYWIGWNEELYLFPTFQQNYVWTKSSTEGSKDDESFTFQTSEGLNVNTDIGISYHLDAEKVPQIFQKYRRGIDEITHIFMRNTVRDAFNSVTSQYPVESAYGKGKSELIDKVQKSVANTLSPQGIIIDKLYWVGSMRLPENVTAALNNKIAATQAAEKSENELRMAEAEAKKKIAEARGEAEANRLRSSSMSEQMIEFERMRNERAAIDKWDGKLPETMIPGTSLPFVNLKKQKE